MIEYIFLTLFFVFIILEIFAEFKDNDKLIYFTKPLLMPLLILFYVFGVIEVSSISQIDWFIVIALIGGCSGDILFMLKDQDKWFLYGLGGYLVNQVFYIMSFLLSITDYTVFNAMSLFLLGPSILIIVFTLPRFINKTGDLKGPILVYMMAILIMHISALLRVAQFQGLGFIFVFVGSLSYAFSDALLAINKWAGEFTNAKLIIITTYVMAQFYIVLGSIFSILP